MGETLKNTMYFADAGDTIKDLQELLFRCFPEQNCEPWDNCGLVVGDSTRAVKGVAIALDPTVCAIKKAADADCNVLLTHHPPYLESPKRIVTFESGGNEVSEIIMAAIKLDVALVAMHTNLDRSPLATQALIDSLDLHYVGEISESDGEIPSFGCLAAPKLKSSITLNNLANQVQRAYGKVAKVWGNPNAIIRRIAIANGSSSSLMSDIVKSRAECLITGEMSYHTACELVSYGRSVIEVGHDVSELPLLMCLRKAIVDNPVFGKKIVMLNPDIYWWQPRAV